MSSRIFEIGPHTVEIGNADKLMFPEAGVTKGDLADYYARIAEVMVPHVRERPLTLQRFPEGVGATGFYQKKAPDYFPEWMPRVRVEVGENGETQPQVVCNDAASLVYLVDQACITPHLWLSRADKLRRPDKMIFDLDPPGDTFEAVRFAAQSVREILEEVGLSTFLMTTGSQGLHVVVPLDRSADFDAVRAFARDVAELVSDRHTDRLTTQVRKGKRRGRVFLDYLRNAYAQTSVAPYAVRARPEAPVATPLGWDELRRKDLHARSYRVDNILRRMGQKDDPWKDIWQYQCSLDEPRHRLDRLASGE